MMNLVIKKYEDKFQIQDDEIDVLKKKCEMSDCNICGYQSFKVHFFICEECNESICSNCLQVCKECRKAKCSACLNKCNNCDSQLCKECSRVCEGCNLPSCQECYEKCFFCNSKICKKCLYYKL